MATKKKPAPTTPVLKKVPIAEVRKQNQALKEKLQKYESYGYCYLCDTHKSKDKFYYNSDPLCKSEIAPICKECARKIAYRVDKNGERHEPTKESVIEALRYLNKPFLYTVWDASVQESENLITGKIRTSVFESYVKNIAMQQYLTLTFKDSDMFKQKVVYEDEKTLEQVVEENAGQDTYDDYLKNKKDCTRLLGYDPFDKELPGDQPFLYAQLIGLIDSSGNENEDIMRNISCASIARGFLQIQKIDNTVSSLMSDVKNMERNAATIKSLQDSKQKLTSMITSLAAESCISLKNNKNAKKGENSWVGRLKTASDLSLRESRLNGFDIETSKGMQQVADISIKAILNQLHLDESEYADMLADQTRQIDALNKEIAYTKEIARILLEENINLRDILQKNQITTGYKLINLDDLLFSVDHDEEGQEDDKSEKSDK